MRILILTQKIDKSDDVLGFMHGWVLEFAKNFEKVTAVCLQKGEHDLPANVKVLSLGKPAQDWSASGGKKLLQRLKAFINFYKYIWQERNNYDAVFVHMNPEYMALGGWLWKLVSKKTSLWYNHPSGGPLVRFSAIFADRIFFTSIFAYARRFNKSKIMPAGIDTDIFRVDDNGRRYNNSLLSLGRVSPIKRVDLMIGLAKQLDKHNIDFRFDIYGGAASRDEAYYKQVRDDAKELETKGKITFFPGISNLDTARVYNKYNVFINATPSGSLDKTIMEAMACGCLVLVSNKSFVGQIPDSLIFEEDNVEDLYLRLNYLLYLHDEARDHYTSLLIKYVNETHSLIKLIQELKSALDN
ncbi:MAG: glycosyltransferase family 4 protein [Candidatus Vogelbacteria bacterium]|nr:glycosyltransferase family 4 protein [Candidatus Vogelbacteria bacterium]